MYPKISIEKVENGWVVTQVYQPYSVWIRKDYVFSSEKDVLDFVTNSIKDLTGQVSDD